MPLVPCITNSAPGTSLYAPAGAGGGGSFGTDPVVSSLTTNGGATFAGYDIIAAGNVFNLNGSSLSVIEFSGAGLAGQQAFNIIAATTYTDDLVFQISTVNPAANGIQGTSLVIQSDGVNFNGAVSLGATTDGTSYIASAAQGSGAQLSTLNVIADGVNISSLNVSSIKLQSFPVPVIEYGAQTLNAGGSTIIGLDHTYTIPYYPILTYRGNPVTASTLFASTINGDNFAIFGEAGQSVQYVVFGN